MRFMLDTNMCIYLIKRQPKEALLRLKSAAASGVCLSSITVCELEYGVKKSKQVEQNAVSLMRFLTGFGLVPFDDSSARHYGEIRAALEAVGKPIGNMDMLIAAHARALGLVLVTNNEREFSRVEGLLLENWVKHKAD